MPDAPRILKCWTIQQRIVLDQPGEILHPLPPFGDHRWIAAYGWMCRAYARRKRRRVPPHLFWLWEKAGGRVTRATRHERGRGLYGDASRLQEEVWVDVDVPVQEGLRSTYRGWNTLLDFCLEFGRPPREYRDWSPMFRIDRLDPWNPTQVVVPHIRRSWIRRSARFDAE